MAALFTYQPWCKNFKVNFEKLDTKKITVKVEWSQHDSTGCSSLSSEKYSKFTHTHIQTKKRIFFLNILKIFHNTIEVYEKKFKVECTKHKPNQLEFD